MFSSITKNNPLLKASSSDWGGGGGGNVVTVKTVTIKMLKSLAVMHLQIHLLLYLTPAGHFIWGRHTCSICFLE